METTLNERVKTVRKKLGLSQSEFAEAIGVTNTSISRLENGAYEPRKSTLNAICDRYHINREWLFEGEGEMGEVVYTKTEASNHWKDEAYAAIKDQNEFLKKEVEWLRNLISKVSGTPNFLKGIGSAGMFYSEFPANTVRVAG